MSTTRHRKESVNSSRLTDSRLADPRLAELAHDLRNPLASIMSSVELLQLLGKDSKESAPVLESMSMKVRTMATMIDMLFIPASAAVSTGATSDDAPPSKIPLHEDALRILIVDDNEAAADALGKVLTLRGYELAVAYGGTQGLKKVASFAPQVAILDIGMPEIDGYELAAMIHKKNSACTLIALTGYGQADDKARAKAAGFAYHLTKPASITDVETVLRKVRAANVAL